MPAEPKRTKDEVIRALRKYKGAVYLAAEKLGISRWTMRRYLKRWKEARTVLREERGKFLDQAEGKLRAAVNKGNLGAIMFTLKTLGKRRGYVERTEVSGPAGAAVKVYVAKDGFNPED
jgi:hypothetical protein